MKHATRLGPANRVSADKNMRVVHNRDMKLYEIVSKINVSIGSVVENSPICKLRVWLTGEAEGLYSNEFNHNLKHPFTYYYKYSICNLFRIDETFFSLSLFSF